MLVALFTRAWIEIPAVAKRCITAFVALFTRAWIEIISDVVFTMVIVVALFTRAWIEMSFGVASANPTGSPSSRGRGLKF